MNEEKLIEYYNKFNEDKRLNSRHGIVEYSVSMYHIHEILKNFSNPKILDIGAGTGKYSLALYDEGYDVTAVELVKHNLKYITMKNSKIKAYQANAMDLKMLSDNSYDVVILFGPMYHLIDKDEKIKALMEAKRVCKDNGYILISYLTNDYAVIKHGFIDGNIIDSIDSKLIDDNFKIKTDKDSLYSYMRLEDIDDLNSIVSLKRVNVYSVDLLTDYLRPVINKMDDKTFELYLKYVLSVTNRKGMLELSSHILDVLKK